MKPASDETTPPTDGGMQPPHEAKRLAAAVRELNHAPLDATYRAESAAIEGLADCVEALSASAMAANGIRAAAGRLSKDSTSDAERVAAASDALGTAAALLTARGAWGNQEEHSVASRALETAIAKLEPGPSLLEQRASFLAALRAATNLVYIAYRAPLPFPLFEVSRTWTEPKTFCDAVEQTRMRVRALATARSRDARASAADTLVATADTLALDPEARVHTEKLSAVRLQAVTLRRKNSLDGASSVKSALTKVVEICDAAWNTPDLDPWIASAKTSAAAIDEGFVDFQRAPIQDAARTVLNVLIVRARTTHRCNESPPNEAESTLPAR